jgi:serine protease Do
MTGKLKTVWKAYVFVALAASGACTADAAEARQANRGAIVEEPLARQASPEPAPHAQESSVATSGQVDQSRRTAIVRAANRVAPAVVSIAVIRTRQVQARSMYESFFMPRGGTRQSAGFGSGVVVRSDGIVLTNDHVIQDADQIRVTLPDGRDFDAELVGTDPLADIAVLRISGPDLPVAPVGTVQGLMIGEWALAIGNPLGNYVADTEPTVTAGVISAVNRNITPSADGQGIYLGMIQTDASINPGNSGGALVNAAGEVIGINASIISRSGGSEGLGFAIPIDRALRIADDLVRTGEVRRAWVGLDVEPVEADAWGRTRGVRIARVADGSPGDLAALEPGDRLLSANGRSLAGTLDFEGILLDLRAEDALVLEVQGRSRPVTLDAVSFPSETAERVIVLRDLQLITVTPQVRAERQIGSEAGALVTAVSDELSRSLGLAPGDVILRILRTPVRTAEDVVNIFEALRGTGRVPLYFERNGAQYVREFNWRR